MIFADIRLICLCWVTYAEGILLTFLWWPENVKSRSKIALFSNERHFEIWFPKKRIIRFFWSKLSKLRKKDPILHVATTFSLKQGETRTSHGPIPHPLMFRLLCHIQGLCTGKKSGETVYEEVDPQLLNVFNNWWVKCLYYSKEFRRWLNWCSLCIEDDT